jgi:hypothetical protein
VDSLTLQSQGGTALRVFFGAPWLVTTAARRLAAPPPAAPGASLCALPGADALVFFGGDAARGARNSAAAAPDADAHSDAQSADVSEAALRFGEAYALSLETYTWERAPGGRHAGRAGHGAVALPRPAGVPGVTGGTAGGVVAILGGRACAAPGAAPAVSADFALLASGTDGALRWACAAADAAGAPPPPREGVACAASPSGDRLFVFGGVDAAGALCADMACLDVSAMAWLPPPAGAPGRTNTRAARTSVSPPRRTSALGNTLTGQSSMRRRSSTSPSRTSVADAEAIAAAVAAAEAPRPAFAAKSAWKRAAAAAASATAWQAPRARAGAALACDDSGRMLWLYGGLSAGGTVLGDLYTYNADTGAWSPREPALGEAPAPRAGASIAVAGHYLLLAGGTTCEGGRALRDAWALDTHRLVWECLLEEDEDVSADADADASAQPGGVVVAWRGRTLCILRSSGATAAEGGGAPALDLLETHEFALPDDIDALISTRRAASGSGEGATTLRLWSLPLRGSTWLDVAWQPPSRHVERVTGYKLLMAPAGAASVRTVYSGHGAGARVGGLRPATTYICVVKASYDDGGHVWSDTQSFRTAAPKPPAEPAPQPPFCNLPASRGRSFLRRPLTAPVGAPIDTEGYDYEGGDISPSRSLSPSRSISPSGRRTTYTPSLAPAREYGDAAAMDADDDEGGPAAADGYNDDAADAEDAALAERMAAVLGRRMGGGGGGDAADAVEAAAAAAAAWDADGESVVIEERRG